MAVAAPVDCRDGPEYAHGEFPCTVLSVPLPVISPADAVLATKAIVAAAATTAMSNRMFRLPCLAAANPPMKGGPLTDLHTEGRSGLTAERVGFAAHCRDSAQPKPKMNFASSDIRDGSRCKRRPHSQAEKH
jgi:hypothetical protein